MRLLKNFFGHDLQRTFYIVPQQIDTGLNVIQIDDAVGCMAVSGGNGNAHCLDALIGTVDGTGIGTAAGQNIELAGGQAAMYLNGSWLPNEVKDAAGPDFHWGCFSYPALPGGKTGVEAANFGGQVFGINKNSQVADEAFQLIQWLTKGEYDALLSEKSNGIPSDITNEKWPEMLSSVKPVMDTLTTRWSWAVGSEANNDITPMIKEQTLKLCGGLVSADEFVANMMKAAQ